MKLISRFAMGIALACVTACLMASAASAQSPQTLSLTTPNNAVTVPYSFSVATVGFQVNGLTGSGATLVPEYTNDGFAWYSSNADGSKFCDVGTSMTTTGPTVCSASGHVAIRLRVSVAGTGSASIFYGASFAPPAGTSAGGGGGGGGSTSSVGSGSWATTEAAMTTTAAQIVAARTGASGTGRIAITIINSTSSTLYIGPTSSVTASTGTVIAAGSGITLNTTAAFYGLLSSGTGTVSAVETY